MRAAVALAAVLIIAPAVVATSADAPLTIRVADWRVGDTWSVAVATESTFPWLGRQVTFREEYVESARVELGTLRTADASPHEVYWSNRSIHLPGYDRPFLARHANDLTTGESLLAPAFLSYRYGPSGFDLFGLGVYRVEEHANDTLDYEIFIREPELTLYDHLGGVDLAPGTSVTRTIDLRPAHDVLIESTFHGLAFEVVDGQDALRGELTIERTEGGIVSAPLVQRLWLVDDAPLPLRARVDSVAHPVEYHASADLLAFAAGSQPLPRGSCPQDHDGELVPPVPVDLRPYTADGPAAGDVVLELPLAEAVALVRSPIANPGSTPPPKSVVAAGSYTVTTTEDGTLATWLIEFTNNDGTSAEYRVTREWKALLPIPIDSVAQTASIYGWSSLQPDGTPTITLGTLAALRGAFHEEGYEDGALSFYAYSPSAGGVTLRGGIERSNWTQEGTPSTGHLAGTSVSDHIDGASGLSLARSWMVINQTRETSVLGLRYDGPGV